MGQLSERGSHFVHDRLRGNPLSKIASLNRLSRSPAPHTSRLLLARY